MDQAQQLQQEEEQIKKQRMFLGAAKSMIEEAHFEQLLKVYIPYNIS